MSESVSIIAVCVGENVFPAITMLAIMMLGIMTYLILFIDNMVKAMKLASSAIAIGRKIWIS